MYHAVRLSMGDRLFYAPIEAPSAVLDIGTGTGIWAIDVADAYPAAEVVGTDLSPIQPPVNYPFPLKHVPVLSGKIPESRWNPAHSKR